MKNPVHHARTKHIEIQYHYIKARVKNGDVELQYIHTLEQQAYILTMPLGTIRFQLHREQIGAHDVKKFLAHSALSQIGDTCIIARIVIH